MTIQYAITRLLAICLIQLVWLQGCAPQTPTQPDPPFIRHTTLSGTTDMSERKRVALVMKTVTNPFFSEMERGARQAEKAYGIQLIVQAAGDETAVEKQIAIVDELVKEGVDAIVITPADSAGLVPALKRAQNAGVTVVNIDNRLDPIASARFGLKDVPYVSVDNEQGAYHSAKAIADRVERPASAAILEGISAADNAQARLTGALRAFGENPNIQVVAIRQAHWKIDEAYAQTKAILTDFPSVRLIFAANDMMALGALQYLQEAGRADVLVAGFDDLAEARESIRAGKLDATIDQQAARQGYLGVEYAVQALNGVQPPPVTIIDTILVTAQTLP